MDTHVGDIKLPLNAFLLRPGVTPLAASNDKSDSEWSLYLFSNQRLDPLEPEDFELMSAAGHGDVVVAVATRSSAPPIWQRFLSEELSLGWAITASESRGAIVFCAVAESTGAGERIRWVAWTFGSGSRALRRAVQDPRFGLMAVLNLLVDQPDDDQEADSSRTVKGPRMREMRYRSSAPYVQQTGHRAARDIPVDGFRMDRSSDLISTIGSSGAVPKLRASTLLGGRSLRFQARVSQIADLVILAADALEQSKQEHYRQEFTWIDNMALVEDEDTLRQLRASIVSTLIADPNPVSIDAILPDDLLDTDEDRAISKIAFPYERQDSHGRSTLTTAKVSEVMARRTNDAERERMLDANLRFYDELDGLVGVATVLECLCAEVVHDGKHFIAYDGDFYVVQDSYIERIGRELAEIPLSELEFPVYRGETEPAYNSRVGDSLPDSFIHLDAKPVRIPGETTFEACDLVSATGALIHVKRKGKSSVLSHLFLQAANSCELLRRSEEAQRLFHKLLAEHARSPRLLARVQSVLAEATRNRDELEVAFVFLGDWKDRTIANLPLFSRISLVNEARRVRSLGYRVTVKTLSHR